jgi:hypothetical protein
MRFRLGYLLDHYLAGRLTSLVRTADELADWFDNLATYLPAVVALAPKQIDVLVQRKDRLKMAPRGWMARQGVVVGVRHSMDFPQWPENSRTE